MKEITIELDGKKETFDLDLVSIPSPDDLEEINQGIQQQPGLYVWYSYLAERLKIRVEELEKELENVAAKIELRVRKTGILGIRKVTDNTVKAAVISDKEYVEKQQELFAMKKQWIGLRSIELSLRQRKDMLATLSANLRKNQENDY